MRTSPRDRLALTKARIVARLSLVLALAVTVLLTGAPAPVSAQLVNENLQITFPDGFRIDNDQTADGIHVSEMIPRSENRENWTQMVTVKIVFDGSDETPARFEARADVLWKDGCPAASVAHLTDGVENGYAFGLWIQTCPRNPQTGKPETTVLKAIRGGESFYLVQKAFRTLPTNDDVAGAIAYLRKILVCDSRSADHPCWSPKG